MKFTQDSIWTSKERALMSTFRDKFHRTFLGRNFSTSEDILIFLIKFCKIEWDRNGEIRDKGPLSMYQKKEGFSFENGVRYTIITDKSILNDKKALFEAFFHELAHIFLEHTPAHAGVQSDDSDIALMSRLMYDLYEKVSPDFEKQADLMTSVFLFYPYDSFVKDLYAKPNDLRFLSEKYNADYRIVINTILAHSESDTHLFVVKDATDDYGPIFEIKKVPESHDQQIKAFLNDEKRLLTEDTALHKSLISKKDETSVSDSGYNVSFHCKAFYMQEDKKIVILGIDNGQYQELIALARRDDQEEQKQ